MSTAVRLRTFSERLLDRRTVIGLYALLAVAVSVQAILVGPRTFVENAPAYTDYNNYVIFRQAAVHLVTHQPLYVHYPTEHWDLFKYTPTFALAFLPFSWLPDLVGLPLWNLLNALVLAFAVMALPQLDRRQQGLVLLIGLMELITSLQNSQSNGLIAGLVVGAFAALERRRPGLAATLIVCAGFIKPFGLAAGLLLLAYPGFWRGVGWGAVSAVLLAAAPLVVVAPGELVQIYRDWLGLLGADHSLQYGYSVMGWLATWFQWLPSKTAVLGAGLLLLVLPYLRRSAFADPEFRLQLLAFLLIWLVIFNHMAESPTFVIAMTGVALWFVPATKDRFTVALFILAFLLTSLSATDLFPRGVREAWVKPYVLKAVPCIVIAAVLWVRLMVPSVRMGQVTDPS
jgi:hypothetical protein